MRMLGAGRPFVLEISNPVHGHPSEAVLRRIEDDIRAANWCAGRGGGQGVSLGGRNWGAGGDKAGSFLCL